jgi:CMP-N,N'-diacetyllegionaminic acid synthase
MMLAVIPARGGSKGLPGKNIRPLAGLPLIAHSIALAKRCPEITRTIVTTDSAEIAAVAREFGADLPFIRPAALAQDDTPIWPVLRHALETTEVADGRRYDYLLLLDPTSPGRLPEDVARAAARLEASPGADGIIGVSVPEFNPVWHCVVERNGVMEDLIDGAARFGRRQDVPTVYRINASLYIWRASFVRAQASDWRSTGRHLLHEVPDVRAIHIDTIDEFERAELFIREGIVMLPWLLEKERRQGVPVDRARA